MAFNFDTLCSNLIPTGKYKVQVTDVKFKTNSLGECSRDIAVTYTIIDGPQAKKTIGDTIYEKAFSFRLKPFLVACKVDTARQFATAEEMFKFGLQESKNKIVMIDVGIKPYNGKDYNQVTNIYPIADSSVTAEDVMADFGSIPDLSGSVTATSGASAANDILVAEEPALDIDLNISEDDLPY